MAEQARQLGDETKPWRNFLSRGHMAPVHRHCRAPSSAESRTARGPWMHARTARYQRTSPP
eukprot:8643314-Pyramimonas_sp.AAC.1